MISKTYFIMQSVESKEFFVTCMTIDEDKEKLYHAVVKGPISDQKNAEEYRKAFEENAKNSS